MISTIVKSVNNKSTSTIAHNANQSVNKRDARILTAGGAKSNVLTPVVPPPPLPRGCR